MGYSEMSAISTVKSSESLSSFSDDSPQLIRSMYIRALGQSKDDSRSPIGGKGSVADGVLRKAQYDSVPDQG
jgi:hypothetical protein